MSRVNKALRQTIDKMKNVIRNYVLKPSHLTVYIPSFGALFRIPVPPVLILCHDNAFKISSNI